MTTYFEDHYYGEESGDPSLAASMAVMMNWAGAGLSLVLIGGLAVWGYNLLMRDVTGVPVIRALEGPMRVAPEDPGGLRAEYQDLSVTRVAVTGAEETPTDRVVLAPEPVALTAEDQPVAALLPDDPEPAPELAALAEEAPATEPAEEPMSAIELAIAEALGQSSDDITVDPAAVEAELAGLDILPASVKGVTRSPRPPMRPASLVTVMPASTEVPANALDVEPTAVAEGTRLVQLGAFPTPEEAISAWDALATQFEDYMTDKQRVIQEAQAGGKTFYRLRAMGYEDLSDARRFCAVLVAGSANCIPVLHR
jgi:hypothetical protein